MRRKPETAFLTDVGAALLQNYLVTAVRNIRRHKLFSVINVAGLALALTCTIFIILFVADELSYDHFIPDMASVYRVDFGYDISGSNFERSAQSPFPLGPAMKAEIPQVISYTHIEKARVTLNADQKLFSQNIEIVDPSFFKVIPLAFAAGGPRRAFTLPNSIVLSRSMALKLFGSPHPVGRIVMVNGHHPMIVTAILEDLPHNTQLRANVLIPNTSKADPIRQSYKTNWEVFSSYLYVRLIRGAHTDHVLSLTRHIVRRNIHLSGQYNAEGHAYVGVQPHLTPFVQDHLSRYCCSLTPDDNWNQIYGLLALAGLILLIACFNFTNLSTAQAIQRSREVALRKVHGASQRQLIVQFLGESIFSAILALLAALALTELLAPSIANFTGHPVTLDHLADWGPLSVIIGVAILTGALGGLYPALILSSSRPVTTLRDGGRSGSGYGRFRMGLVSLQFATSIGLGASLIVVFTQIRYAQHMSLGFDRSHIVVVSNVSTLPKPEREDFARAIAGAPSVLGTALSYATPFDGHIELEKVRSPGALEPEVFQLWGVGFRYFRLYHMKLLAGRPLSAARAKDTESFNDQGSFNVIISKMAASTLGYTPQEAIGKVVSLGRRPAIIVGVVANPWVEGPQIKLMPTIFLHNSGMNELSVKFRPGQEAPAIGAIRKAWQRYAPNTAMRWHFLSGAFNEWFTTDAESEHIIGVFTSVAIFVACLGLYGLAAITAQSRTKEIGIRRTFGASTTEILRLLLWQFSIPVLFANAIAWPFAWYYLHIWLQGYAARIRLSPIYFLAAGLIALTIAWFTVAAHAFGAARTKPAQSLRYE